MFLKLVKPGDAIENVIIDQMPELEGMNVSAEKLREILDTLGPRCLIIFEGLDEHALGQNEDVLKIIKGQKFLYCNIVVSSRPHSTTGIETHFQTVVRVDGFTRTEAEKFSFKILNDEKKVADVLNFNPADFREDVFLHHYPILLSFLCLLVHEDDIDLSSHSVTIGEIYQRMIRCLYKKFTIRKGIKYRIDKFIQAITAIGKLAFQMLMSRKSLLRRSEVIEQVGEDAFDYCLLIGQEDFRLIRDETADILVMFPHRTLQEFLGAFFFVLMLNNGAAIESLLGEVVPPFLTNPLFLDFCLWFLYANESIVPVQNRDVPHGMMAVYSGDRIGSHKLAIEDIRQQYPAIDIAAAHKANEILRLKFFVEVLANCLRTRYVLFESNDLLDWTLTAMRPVLKSLWCVSVAGSFQLSCINSSTLVLNMVEVNPSLLDTILKHSQHMAEKPSLHVVSYISTTMDMSKLLLPNFREVRVGWGACLKVIAGRIPYSPSLTRLLFTQSSCSDIVSVLSAAMREGNLPALSHLSFVKCKGLQGKLSVLFQWPWPMLTHLNLCGTSLDATDLELLSRDNFRSNIAPRLCQLVLPLTNLSEAHEFMPTLLRNVLGYLTNFYADCPSKTAVLEMINVMKGGNTTNLKCLGILSPQENNCTIPSELPLEFYPSLETVVLHKFNGPVTKVIGTKLGSLPIRKLDFSYNHGISGTLSVLLCQKFPLLEFLILRDCALNAEDLRSLAEANCKGRLPQMKHLDVSQNSAPLGLLCDKFSVWRQLICLNVARLTQTSTMRRKHLHPGSFPSLRELTFSELEYFYYDLRWDRLETVRLVNPGHSAIDMTDAIVSCLHNFPALRTICVMSVTHFFDFKHTASLAEKNVSCHMSSLSEYTFNEYQCFCQIQPVELSQSD